LEPAILASDALAIASAFFFGTAIVVARRGNLVGTTAAGGYFVNVLASTILFTAILPFILPRGGVPIFGIVLYSLSGITGTLLGRAIQYVAINKMGAATAAPLTNTYPIFTAAIAIGFLGENVSVPILLGTILTILGVATLSSGGEYSRGWKTRYIAVPLTSAFFIAMGTVLRKVAVGLIPDPVFGVAITNYTAFLVYLPFMGVTMHKVSFKITRRGALYFVAVGLLSSVALIAQFAALTNGLVVVVSPLLGISPIFTFLLAFLFLRREERFTYRLILAVLLVVIGVVLVTA
jgi:drug/metabolite transporter (DMT)-like permease